MRKNFILSAMLFAASALVSFSSCSMSSGGSDDNNFYAPQAQSFEQRLLGSESVIDLGNGTYTQNTTVSRAVTIKNADFSGKTMAIKASDVRLENIRNLSVIVDPAVGEGNFYMENCSGISQVTVSGGGSNSIHFKNTAISKVAVNKNNARIVLEENSSITSIEVRSRDVKLEGGQQSAIGKVSVAADAVSVKIGGGKIDRIIAKSGIRIEITKNGTKIGTVRSSGSISVEENSGITLESQPSKFENSDISSEYESIEPETAKNPARSRWVEVKYDTDAFVSDTYEYTKLTANEKVFIRTRLMNGTVSTNKLTITRTDEYNYKEVVDNLNGGISVHIYSGDSKSSALDVESYQNGVKDPAGRYRMWTKEVLEETPTYKKIKTVLQSGNESFTKITKESRTPTVTDGKLEIYKASISQESSNIESWYYDLYVRLDGELFRVAISNPTYPTYEIITDTPELFVVSGVEANMKVTRTFRKLPFTE